jgi:Ubiquitin carboxyl-terminal hydrolase
VGGMGSGHYTAYGKNRFDDAWYEFNDSTCRRVTEKTLVRNRSSAYLLFYNRVEQPPPTFPAPNGTGREGAAGLRHRAPLVRRQSVSRPDLWPHAQVQNNQYREFARQSARSLPDPPLFSLNDQGEDSAKLPPTDEGKSLEL